MNGREHDLGAGDCEELEARTVFPDLRRSCPACVPVGEHVDSCDCPVCENERALDDDADAYRERLED